MCELVGIQKADQNCTRSGKFDLWWNLNGKRLKTALYIYITIIGSMFWFESFSDKVDKKDKGSRRS